MVQTIGGIAETAVKFALRGLFSKDFYKKADIFYGATLRQDYGQKNVTAATTLFNTASDALAAAQGSTGTNLELVRVTITEKPGEPVVHLFALDKRNDSDKYALALSGGGYIGNTTSGIGAGFFAREKGLNTALLFDTERDARLLLPTAGAFFGTNAIVVRVSEGQSVKSYEWEVLK
jgi:hypothetical protein